MGGSAIKNPRRIFSQAGGGDTSSIITRITNLENVTNKITYYEIISGTSGTLTLPTGATINAGEFAGLNCILSEIDGNSKPTYISPQTSGGVLVTATLNIVTGGWTTSGAYTSSNIVLIYSIEISEVNVPNLNQNRVIVSEKLIPVATSGGFPITLTVTASTNVTLPISGTLYGTATGSFTSAQLANSLTDETGTGSAVFGTSPTFTTKITTPEIDGVSGATGLTIVTNNTASSALAKGINYTPTLVAAANNDVLNGLFISPTFTNGAFTGVTNWATNIQGDALFKVGTTTAGIQLRGLIGTTTSSALYMNATTPTSSNYILSSDGNITKINGGGALFFALNSSVYFQLDGSNTRISIAANILFGDNTNWLFGTSTGTKIGTLTSQKIGFWNATPIVQPTTAIAAATFAANTSGTLNDSATWGGYTMGQVVQALRNEGLLA